MQCFLFKGSREGAIHDVHKATMCWKPLDEKKRTRREESKLVITLNFTAYHFVHMPAVWLLISYHGGFGKVESWKSIACLLSLSIVLSGVLTLY